MEEKPKRTELRELGEFGLIDRIKEKFSITNKSSILGIGDDAALIDAGDHFKVITSDMLLEGVHFDLSYMPLVHLGYKAIAVNVSDIAAMNAIPKQVTVNIAVSNRFSVEAIEALYEGIAFACKNYKVDLVGGDTTSSSSGLVISVTAIGEAKKNTITKRNTANKGDIICVSGDLGAAYVGLQVLEREKQVFQSNPEMQPDLSKYEYMVGRQLKPEARMDLIYDLAELGIVPTAMMDISDGLASELFHICSGSQLGVKIYEDKLPIDQEVYKTAVEFNLDPVTCALNGGEDYELLFTIKQEDYEKLKNHADISTVGYMDTKENGLQLITKGGNAVPLTAQGWDHFKN
ncbi:thiamine-phosphate kinase [Xanthovirga aplysinae]|uniref:thiamine-phosphate kinase n=1 Tax=Xanthovirga aplysinae TaxID=2529853 RepID=UPI0012BBE39C|nr:thiamine-phosphate kinase [Xanthovirga aplysinae]MTI31050.1 thiamine-phosphate kinase [Xanthovirga aplysinae]